MMVVEVTVRTRDDVMMGLFYNCSYAIQTIAECMVLGVMGRYANGS